MPKKSLQDWYNSNDITYTQKEIIKKFGVGDYYPECERRDFLKIYHWNNILERNISKLESGQGNDLVYQMDFFSTWWNNNLIIFIKGEERNYHLRLIIYEMPHKKMREIFEVFSIDWIYPGTLHEAREEARRAREKLKSDEPIPFGILTTKLSISYYDDYNCSVFPITYGTIWSEKVKRIQVDFSSARYNPDDYFKPLDIAMICRERGMVHTCIYLGSGKICHALSGNQVRIGDWNSFFILTGANKMLCYHPVIAFKKTDEIIKHIANCVEGKKEYYRRKGDFNIFLNNCEHFVNRCVLGLDYSELDERRSESGSRKMELNIERELKKTKEALDKVDNDVSWGKVNNTKNEIKEYRRNSGYESFDVMRDGYNMYDTCIEVQPKYIFKELYNNMLMRIRNN